MVVYICTSLTRGPGESEREKESRKGRRGGDERRMEEPSTLAQLARWAAARYGDGCFLQLWSETRGVTRSLSFRQFHLLEISARQRLGMMLIERGLPLATGRVALLSHACADSLALSLAVTALGRTLVCLNWRQPPPVLAQLLRGLHCDVLLAGRSFVGLAREIAFARSSEGMGQAALVILIDGAEDESGLSLNEEIALNLPAVHTDPTDGSSITVGLPQVDADVSPSDTAVIMFTSGTSSLPKAVPLTHGGLLWSCAAKAQAEREHLGLDFMSPASWGGQGHAQQLLHRGTLAFLPTFHVIGFTNNFLYNLLVRV